KKKKQKKQKNWKNYQRKLDKKLVFSQTLCIAMIQQIVLCCCVLCAHHSFCCSAATIRCSLIMNGGTASWSYHDAAQQHVLSNTDIFLLRVTSIKNIRLSYYTITTHTRNIHTISHSSRKVAQLHDLNASDIVLLLAPSTGSS